PEGALCIGLDQAPVPHALEHAIDDSGELALAPGQEQLCGDVRINAPCEAVDVIVPHLGVAREDTCQQRWHGEKVQHVVAEIGGEHGALVAHAQDVTQRMLLALQHLHRLAVGDDAGAAEVGEGDPIAVGKAAQERAVEVDLPLEVALGKRLARHGEKNDGKQIDRGDRRSSIDVAHDAAGEVVDRDADPRRSGLFVERTGAPATVVAIQNLFEGYGLTEVRRAFDDSLVAEIDGQEDHGPSGIAQKAAHGHREHAGHGLQQTAGAAAAAFDEVLDGMAPRHDGGEVLHEDDGIEAIAAELAADEKGAPHAQQPANDGNVEVDAGGDVRHRIAVDVNDIRQQQVVHVAAVTGHVDDLVALRYALEGLQMSDRDPVIKAIPEPGQQTLEEADESMRVVRGNFFRVARRLQQRHPPRQ